MKLSVRETRQLVYHQTLQALDHNKNLEALCSKNLQTWKNQRLSSNTPKVIVVNRDWGDATLESTKKHGTIHAVLNMANSIIPGGGVQFGCGAQEENLFRRSNCSLYDCPKIYPNNLTNLLTGQQDVVYLDVDRVRVCIRGPENLKQDDLGYRWLNDNEIFPFFEMRASALDLNTERWNEQECIKRITAQFNTLLKNNIKHVVLGAFGCGCFKNPPEFVANCYKKQILQHQNNFDAVVFAILGDNNNFVTFKDIIPQLQQNSSCDVLVA